MLLGDRVRWSEVEVTEDGSGVLVGAVREGRVTLLGRGEPGAVVRLVHRRTAERLEADRPADVQWMSLPRGARVGEDLLEPLGLRPFSQWDWLLAEGPPPVAPGEDEVLRLDRHADAAAIRRCLEEANPGTTADPTADREAAWVGVRDADGELVGVFGASRRGGALRDGALRDGAADGGFSWHLHGLGVRPEGRGRGLGAALTAALTRAGFDEGADWVSLGMYADNEVARRIYHRLGYVTVGEFDSYGPAGADRPPT